MTQISLTIVVFAILLVAIDSYSFWGSAVSQRKSFSNGFVKYSNSFRSSKVESQMTSSSSSYTSSTPSELFAHILSDEEEEEEPEAPPATTEAPSETSEGMSSVKEGIMFPTTLNGTDVRVGIIMARWNSDIIAGLYKVISCTLPCNYRSNCNVFFIYLFCLPFYHLRKSFLT
jgi:hypothetical protein